MKVYSGIDPSSRSTGWAQVCVESGILKLLECGVILTPSELKGIASVRHQVSLIAAAQQKMRYSPDIVAIESQQTYTQGKQAQTNTEDLRLVSFVTGAWIAAYPMQHLLIPKPAKWKGQASKKATQALVQARLDISSLPGEIPKSSVSDVYDAIGLAIYAYDRTRGRSQEDLRFMDD